MARQIPMRRRFPGSRSGGSANREEGAIRGELWTARSIWLRSITTIRQLDGAIPSSAPLATRAVVHVPVTALRPEHGHLGVENVIVVSGNRDVAHSTPLSNCD